MNVNISDKELLKLYTTGKSKKLKYSKDIIEKFIMRVQTIISSVNIHDFWKDPAINFEKLQGYDNRYSMKLNNKYRLEMEIDWENKEKTMGTFYIKEISTHYQ